MGSGQTATIVVAACIEQDGRLLVRRRTEGSEPSTLYKWEFPGGRVLYGEEFHAALQREIKEELNLVVRESPPARLVHAQTNSYDSGTDYLVLYFHCQVCGHVEYDDPTKFLFLIPDEIINNDTFPGFLPGTVAAASVIGGLTEWRPFSFVEHDVSKQTPDETLHVMTYELGRLIEHYHKGKRYGEQGYLGSARKELAGIASMCRMYSEQRGWNFEELLKLGEEDYLERMEDIRRHGIQKTNY